MCGGPTAASFTETPFTLRARASARNRDLALMICGLRFRPGSSARRALHGGLAMGRQATAFGFGLGRTKQCFLQIRDFLGKHRPLAGEGGMFGALRFGARLEIGPRGLWLDSRLRNHRQGRLFGPLGGLLLLLCRERRRDEASPLLVEKGGVLFVDVLLFFFRRIGTRDIEAAVLHE